MLRPNAVPRIFEGVPSYLSTPSAESRSSPSKRRKIVVKRHMEQQSEWVNSDQITSYEDFRRSVVEHVTGTHPSVYIKLCNDHVMLCNLYHTEDVDHGVSVSSTIRILLDMSVRVFIKGDMLPDNAINWAVSHTNGVLKFWSQLDTVMTRYLNSTPDIDSVSRCTILAESIAHINPPTDDQQQTLMFLAEQLNLLHTKPKGRRYSTDLLIRAFTWYHKSTACYLTLQRLFCLPSVRLLRGVASYLNVGGTNSSYRYLANKVKYLKPHELLVTLQLDEIHIKPKMTYQNGKLIGNAGNSDTKQANRVQTFMISSVLSSNKDVVALIPVQKMTTQDLSHMTKEVVKNVTISGYRILCIISDNNIVNRKMFIDLAGTDHLVPYMNNPINNEHKIYLLFDTVHLLKCIRNNWINDAEKTFRFPNFCDNDVIMNASFSDLITIYHMEKDSTLKEGYQLTWKSLFPNSIERQNVKLALKIFDRTTVAALEVLGPQTDKMENWKGTAMFVKTILKFWNIVNVKNTTKGLHKLLDDAKVIDNVDDDRIDWLNKFSCWLKLWHNDIRKQKEGHLTKETFTALTHTVDTLILLIKDLLEQHKFNYVLLGKFQTDNLEARFGQYRMLSGSNYLVSVNEVLQSEKKLKVKNLLRLYTSSKGVIKIKDFFMEFSDISIGGGNVEFINSFPFNKVSSKVRTDDLAALLYTAGYVARKARSYNDCMECKELFGNKESTIDLDIDPKHLQYIANLDRGGLIYPSNLLFMILQASYSIFNMCVTGELEKSFLKLDNQKQTLIRIIEQFITSDDNFIGIYYVCELCETTCITPLLKALGCFCNICLNNYSKKNSDKMGNSKTKIKTIKLN